MLYAVVNFPHSLSATGFGEREYTYKTYHENLKKGMIVVVEAQTGYSTARFVRYTEDAPNHIELKYIVQPVNLARHKRLKEECENDMDDWESLLD